MLKHLDLLMRAIRNCRNPRPDEEYPLNGGLNFSSLSRQKRSMVLREINFNMETGLRGSEDCSRRCDYLLVLNGVLLAGLFGIIFSDWKSNFDWVILFSALLLCMSTVLLLYMIVHGIPMRITHNEKGWRAADLHMFDIDDFDWVVSTEDREFYDDYFDTLYYIRRTMMRHHSAMSFLLTVSAVLTSAAVLCPIAVLIVLRIVEQII